MEDVIKHFSDDDYPNPDWYQSIPGHFSDD